MARAPVPKAPRADGGVICDYGREMHPSDAASAAPDRMGTLEDQPEDTGHLVVHQRGGPMWLKEHVTALRSLASTIAGAEV